MDEAMTNLAERAVKANGWEWMPGMRVASTKWARVLVVDEHEMVGAEEGATEDDNYAVWLSLGDGIPDLSDAATIGCLLALVRKKHNDPSLCVVFDHDDKTWAVGRWEDGLALRSRSASTEAEALVAALEAE